MADIKSKDITNLQFALGYNYKYRYIKHKLLENQYDKLEKIVPGLIDVQYEYLRLMIEIDMIINFIQYCNELGTFAICTKNKQFYNLNNFLAGIEDKDIIIFYDKIGNMDIGLIREYMGYHEIKKTRFEYERYDNSCKRYQNDVSKLTKLYKHLFSIYLSYKHGFRLIPVIDQQKGKFVFEARKDSEGGPLAWYQIPESWQIDVIELMDIINNIFERLYMPLIRKKFEDFAGISFANDNITTFMKSTDITESSVSSSQDFDYSLPWYIHEAKEQKPFY